LRRQREPSLETLAISQFFALFNIFKPLKNAWWAIFGANISWGLHTIYSFLAANPILAAIGAYGLSIIILTILIKTILSPLYQLQLRLSRRSMMEQRKLAPELAALRKKYKNDPQKQQSEMMALYKEHGVNPLGGLTGCLPALLQFPILTALYYVFLGNAKNHTFPTDHFLFVPHLNVTPGSHPLFAGLPIPSIEYAIIPLLAQSGRPAPGGRAPLRRPRAHHGNRTSRSEWKRPRPTERRRGASLRTSRRWRRASPGTA